MKKNVGSTDKVIRISVAVLILTLALTNVITGVWAAILIILAAILLVTSFISLCPLYLLFGIRSNMKKE